ncbi:MAG: hypothetical protein ACSW8F_06340 [bacterium]
MKEDCVRSYCRRVGEHMPCRRSTRRRLLAGLERQLREREDPDLSFSTLNARVGRPADVAAELMASLELAPIRYERRALVALVLALLLAACAFCGLILWSRSQPQPPETILTEQEYRAVMAAAEQEYHHET